MKKKVRASTSVIRTVRFPCNSLKKTHSQSLRHWNSDSSEPRVFILCAVGLIKEVKKKPQHAYQQSSKVCVLMDVPDEAVRKSHKIVQILQTG